MKDEILGKGLRKTMILATVSFLWTGFSGGADVRQAASPESRTQSGGEPLLLKPVALHGEDGKTPLRLVDPFRRRSESDVFQPTESGEDGYLRTTMGSLSKDFKILGIVLASDTNALDCALIQLENADDPVLVHEGDLVRVDRSGSGSVRRGGVVRKGAKSQGRERKRSGSAIVDLDEELEKFVFYVNIKTIEPTYIEVYHNKKRPDETIRLSW